MPNPLSIGSNCLLVACWLSACSPATGDPTTTNDEAAVELAPPPVPSVPAETCNVAGEELTEADVVTLCSDNHDARLALVTSIETGDDSSRALSMLQHALQDADVRVRRQAVARIAELGPSARPLTLALVATLEDSSEPVADRARSALVALDSDDAAAALLLDLRAAQESEELERRLAMVAHSGHPDLLPFYGEVITTHDEASLRALGARGLIAGEERSAEVVQGLLAAEHESVRALAYRIAGALPRTVATDIISSSTADATLVDRIWQNAARSRATSEPIGDVIRTTLDNERSVPAVEAALDACAYVGSEETIGLLIVHLADPRLPNSRHAQTLLLRLGMDAREGILAFLAEPPSALGEEESEQLFEVIAAIATPDDVEAIRESANGDDFAPIESQLVELADDLRPTDTDLK